MLTNIQKSRFLQFVKTDIYQNRLKYTVERRLSERRLTESPIIRIGPKRNIEIKTK